MLRKIPIERISDPGKQQFAKRYLRGVGLPVILRDATKQWPALSRWNFNFFREHFGNDTVFPGIDRGVRLAKATSLKKFIDYIEKPASDLEGPWVYSSNGKLIAQTPPTLSPTDRFYLLNWYGFHRHPELLKDIRPYDFISDWVAQMPKDWVRALERIHEVDYWSILVGPEGTVTRLHQDFASTHGSLTQIVGRKKVLLFSPNDSEALQFGSVDPESPTFGIEGKTNDARAFECILEPGELLFWPARWWHHVRSLEPSISVSHNFFNKQNALAHLSYIGKDLPYYLRGFLRTSAGGLAPHRPFPKH